MSLIPVGSSGTDSTGGSHQPPQTRQESASTLFWAFFCSFLCASLNAHNDLQGLAVTRYGGKKGRRRLKEQVILHGRANRNICRSSLTCVSNIKREKRERGEKPEEASSESTSTFQLRSSECWDNVVIRKWMNGTAHPFCLLPCRAAQYFPRTACPDGGEERKSRRGGWFIK